jgi:hypothetical protein
MLGLDALAKQHRDFFYRLVDEVGRSITIRKTIPAPTASITAATRVLGAQVTQSNDSYPEIPVTAIVTGASSVTSLNVRNPGDVAPIGLVQSSEILLRVKLVDVIVDSDDVYGPTLFDIAHDVFIGDSYFKVVGVERSGLPPLTPYIVWVGLKSAGKK